ncbi:MAG: DUF2867 domain-containing protein [Chloroflexota bacterium]
MQYLQRFPQLASLYDKADHVDVKVVEGNVNLRAFVAGMMNYQPAWVTALYGVRAVFVRFLGMRQEGIPKAPALRTETIPMIPGERASFFTVEMAKEDQYWVVRIDDSHLKAALGVVVEPLQNGLKRFHVITIVHYHNWTGPVYFNVIRPFHHLVVGGMAKARVSHA